MSYFGGFLSADGRDEKDILTGIERGMIVARFFIDGGIVRLLFWIECVMRGSGSYGVTVPITDIVAQSHSKLIDIVRKII